MISREMLKTAIDGIDDSQLEILHRSILAFSQPIPNTINPTVNPPLSDNLLENINPLKGSIIFENDIISPIDLLWEAEHRTYTNQPVSTDLSF